MTTTIRMFKHSKNWMMALSISLTAITGSASSVAVEPSNEIESQSASTLTPELQFACKQFADYTVKKGHFEGGKWDDALDKWGGEKHLLMQQLEETIKKNAQSGLTGVELTAQCPAPKQKIKQPNPMFNLALSRTEWRWGGEKIKGSAPENISLSIYPWRGEHDYLVVAIVKNRVTAVGWVMAGE